MRLNRQGGHGPLLEMVEATDWIVLGTLLLCDGAWIDEREAVGDFWIESDQCCCGLEAAGYTSPNVLRKMDSSRLEGPAGGSAPSFAVRNFERP